MIKNTDTICALATPPGIGAIAVIRISGMDSFGVVSRIFRSAKANFDLHESASHTLHFGSIYDSAGILDEVLVSIFRKPHSYTGEDSIEISCHGSVFIQQKIIELLIEQGCRLAQPGEFTLRAFLNGRYDLSQAEAVADLIASQSRSSHGLALEQMRGSFSSRIKELREQLISFASLIELELDFSEEDVEFADRGKFAELLNIIDNEVNTLINSFKLGNVLKGGIPVAIIGKTNVGKSTLLNALLQEEKAIVSEIPGTTRDFIEDTIVINGISFRFIDTAGLRESEDAIENIGIERTYEKLNQARIVLFVFDISSTTHKEIKEILRDFEPYINNSDKKWIFVANKTDLLVESPPSFKDLLEYETVFISAKRKENINMISGLLSSSISTDNISDAAIVSNIRHYESLQKTLEAIESVKDGMKNQLTGDLLAIDLHMALHHLGEITGEITSDTILENIFSRFCIGK